MFTKSDNTSSGRGALTWVSALGLIAMAVGLVVSQTLAADPQRQQAQSTHSDAAQLPFVVAPTVRFEKVTPPGPSRTAARGGNKTDDWKTGPAAAAGVPVGLVIPGLGVDVPVFEISAADGVLTPPDDPQTLGWWSGGAMPGAARGGALITGHTIHDGGGAFDDLETLSAGDDVRVRTADGVLRYAVRSVTIYGKASLAEHAAEVFSQSVPGRLVLVTCEDWDGSIYLSNAVVLAEPVRQR